MLLERSGTHCPTDYLDDGSNDTAGDSIKQRMDSPKDWRFRRLAEDQMLAN